MSRAFHVTFGETYYSESREKSHERRVLSRLTLFASPILVSTRLVTNRIFSFYVSERTGVSFSSNGVSLAIGFSRVTSQNGLASHSCLISNRILVTGVSKHNLVSFSPDSRLI